MSLETILALTLLCGGGWGLLLWLPRRKRRNRYITRSVWDITKDPRDWSKQYMDSLKQGRF